jgi:Reverse transcriptase (RNA-dependent DNA polymerase)
VFTLLGSSLLRTREQPPYGTKVVPLKWVYKVKKDRLGAIQRYKCRLVAQGFFQVFGQDYTDTYSPVAKFTSIRTLLAITAQLGLKVHQMDVDTAFLNAPIYGDIWVKVPDGTPLANGDTGTYNRRKALHGLKQAPREWNYHVDNSWLRNLKLILAFTRKQCLRRSME